LFEEKDIRDFVVVYFFFNKKQKNKKQNNKKNFNVLYRANQNTKENF